MTASYRTMVELLETILHDFEILSGNEVGPSGTTWQDVAGTASANLLALSAQLEQARSGDAEPFIIFPSPRDLTAPDSDAVQLLHSLCNESVDRRVYSEVAKYLEEVDYAHSMAVPISQARRELSERDN
jgi:hypothetical protein